MSAMRITFHSRVMKDCWVAGESLQDVLDLLTDIEWTPIAHMESPEGSWFVYYRGRDNMIEMLEVHPGQ